MRVTSHPPICHCEAIASARPWQPLTPQTSFTAVVASTGPGERRGRSRTAPPAPRRPNRATSFVGRISRDLILRHDAAEDRPGLVEVANRHARIHVHVALQAQP